MNLDRQLEVCICLSGQMRGYEQGLPWIYDTVGQISFSVVVATWKNRGGKISAGNRQRLASTLPKEVVETLPLRWAGPQLFEIFPSLLVRAAENADAETITEENIAKVYPTAMTHIEPALRFREFELRQSERHKAWAPDPFSISMLYKIWQADILRKNLEIERGRQFDIIIRARPDFPFVQPTVEFLRGLKDDEIYVDRVDAATRNVGDGFAIGKSVAMRKYALFFSKAIEKFANEEWRYIHLDLFDYLVTEGLKIRTYPMWPYTPDRLLSRTDILEAIRDVNAKSYDPLFAERFKIACLIEEASILSDSRDSEISVGDICVQVRNILEQYSPQRDSGFLFAVSGILVDLEEGFLALIALVISAMVLKEIDSSVFDAQRDDIISEYIRRFFEAMKVLREIPCNILDDNWTVSQVSEEGSKRDSNMLSILQGISDVGIAAECDRQARNLVKLVIAEPDKCIWLAAQKVTDNPTMWAFKVLSRGLQETPRNAALKIAFAQNLAMQGLVERAADLAKECLRANNANVSFTAGQVFLSINDLDWAERAFRQAIDLYPADPDYYMLLSDVLLRTNRIDEAVNFANEAAIRSPFPMAHRHNHLGHVLMKAGMYAAAEQAFVEALRRNPDWFEIRAHLDEIKREVHGH